MLNQIVQLEEDAKADLTGAVNAESLEQFRIKYLGTKGKLKSLMKDLKRVPPEDKPLFGKRANELRVQIQAMFDSRQADLGNKTPTERTRSRVEAHSPKDLNQLIHGLGDDNLSHVDLLGLTIAAILDIASLVRPSKSTCERLPPSRPIRKP